MPEVTLRIRGIDYAGWQAVDVNRSIETIAGAFTLKVTERWRGQQAVAAVTPGDACAVLIDGETVITGHVDEVAPSYDKETHQVSIRGRDATGDLVDCSAIRSPPQWNAAHLVEIAAALTQPFGIPVRAEVPTPGTFLNWVLQTGETVHEAIDRLASTVGVLAVSDGKGGLVFTTAGKAGTHAGIILGENILSAQGQYSDKDRFSQYIVLGQAPGSDFIDPAITAGSKGVAFDKSITRYRPLIIFANYAERGNAVFEQRAQWESTVRLGRAWRATVRLQGWRDAAGALWQPNKLVRLRDEFLAIDDTLLISGVRLSIDESGAIAELTVTRREAFAQAPLPAFVQNFDRGAR